MPDIATQITWLLIVVGPFVGYYVVLRRPGRTRLQLILAATLGAAGPAVLWGAAGALAIPGATLERLPYVLAAAIFGATIGLFGVLARALGNWLGRQS
ncbi:MAG: hypothetical protein ACJ796_05990 [Gemmatimonadaceae bacterium]